MIKMQSLLSSKDPGLFVSALIGLTTVFNLVFLLNPAFAIEKDRGLSKTDQMIILKMLAHHPAKLRVKSSLDFQPPQPARLEELHELIFNIFTQERFFKGEIAFYFLFALIKTESSNTQFYRQYVKNHLAEFELNPEQREWIDTILNSDQPISLPFRVDPESGFEEALLMIDRLPFFVPNKQKTKEALSFLKKMIIGKNKDCYTNDPECVHFVNSGLAQYSSQLLESDHELFRKAISFYVDQYKRSLVHKINNDHLTFESPFREKESWNELLGYFNQDAFVAIRILGMFYHDECCLLSANIEGGFGPLILLLQKLAESKNFKYYIPGALKGLAPSPYYQRKFQSLRKQFKKEFNDDRPFYLNNYHFYGGMFVANELLRHGHNNINGIDFSGFVNEALGYFYKKFTSPLWMNEDVTYLWTQVVHENPYLRPIKPAHWSVPRFRKAALILDMLSTRILYTAEQHRRGAEFASEIFATY